MARCDVCGNDDEQSLEVHLDDAVHTFDSFECAIDRLAPTCEHCGGSVPPRKPVEPAPARIRP